MIPVSATRPSMLSNLPPGFEDLVSAMHAAWARQGCLAFPLFATQATLAGMQSPARRAFLANLSENLLEAVHSPTPRPFEAELDRPPVDVTELTQLTGNKPPKRRGGSAHRQHKKPVRPAHDPASPFPETIDADAVAVALGCSLQHVYAMAASGRLPHSRLDGRIRFPVIGIQDYLRDHEVA